MQGRLKLEQIPISIGNLSKLQNAIPPGAQEMKQVGKKLEI
jgi:hypothetical protein